MECTRTLPRYNEGLEKLLEAFVCFWRSVPWLSMFLVLPSCLCLLLAQCALAFYAREKKIRRGHSVAPDCYRELRLFICILAMDLE